MDKVEFTKIIKEVVAQSAIENTLDNLNDPPGRNPNRQLLAQSEWFKALAPHDREILGKVISEAVHESVFGFLSVLDGVRSLSEVGESNDLHLSLKDVHLNDTTGELLHDIYKNI